jgi:hydroxymethylbilane synthase
MAAAGLQRIGFENQISEIIDEKIVIPAVSQGIIAIESRKNDNFVKTFIDKITDNETLIAAKAERCFLNVLEGGCQVPVGCFTKIDKDSFTITGFISMPDGNNMIKGSFTGNLTESENIAMNLALSFFDKGARKIIEYIRNIEIQK